MFLAVRNLFQNKTRFTLTVAGVALAVMLILLMGGFLSGMYRQLAAYPERVPGSVVVAQEGMSGLRGGTSLLPLAAADQVLATDGVERAVPILSQFVILDLHGRKQPVYLVGYDPALGGGPWRMTRGAEPRADDEVVFDRRMAERHGLTVGDTFAMMDRPFRIAGLSDGTTSFMTSYLFVRKSAAEKLLIAPGATSFLFVTPSDGVTAEVLRDRLRAVPGTSVLLKQELIANDPRLLAEVFSGPLWLMSVIAFFIGMLVVGLVIYTATVERQREYGVLKAIGARNRRLYCVVAAQALIAASAGALLGVVLTLAVGQLIMVWRPQFLITLEAGAAVRALLVGLMIALLAAVAPARVVARLAPADVFRR
jgi:putative ABC transport system permease protein